MSKPAKKQSPKVQQSRHIPVPLIKPLRKSVRDALAGTIFKDGRDGLIALMQKNSGTEFVRNEAREIEKWPDYKFLTEDGRTFGLFLDGDTILKRLDAAHVMINRKDKEGIKRIEGIAGFILEIGSDDPPLVFNEKDHLLIAWAETHLAYGVEPTDEEFNELIDLPDLWQEPDEDGE